MLGWNYIGDFKSDGRFFYSKFNQLKTPRSANTVNSLLVCVQIYSTCHVHCLRWFTWLTTTTTGSHSFLQLSNTLYEYDI